MNEFKITKSQKKVLIIMCIFWLLVYVGVVSVKNMTDKKEKEKEKEINLFKVNSEEEIKNLAEIHSDKNNVEKVEMTQGETMRPVESDDLKVPFYMYENEKIDQVWKLCYNESIIKKRAALQFVQQLRNHQWRTYDPEKASVYIIPLAFMDESKVYGDHFGCQEFPKLIHPILSEIRNGSFFKRMDGRDHILVDPWWRTLTLFHKWGLIEMMDKMIIGVSGAKKIFSNRTVMFSGLEKRCGVYVPFDPNYDEMGTKDINEREVDFFFLGEIDKMKPYRKNIFEKFPRIEGKISRLIDVGTVLNLPKCNFTDGNLLTERDEASIKCKMNKTKLFAEWTKNSKFSLMFRGHDFQSERLFSALSFGAINLIFSDYIYETGVPFQCFVPWRNFTFQVNSTRFLRDPLEELKNVIDISPERLKEVQNLIFKYQRDVLWTHPESRVAENILKSSVRKCFTLQNIQQKKLDYFLRFQCQFKDVEDRFGDKIVLHNEIM